jgi:hypothetical protein
MTHPDPAAVDLHRRLVIEHDRFVRRRIDLLVEIQFVNQKIGEIRDILWMIDEDAERVARLIAEEN